MSCSVPLRLEYSLNVNVYFESLSFCEIFNICLSKFTFNDV